ncbi:hypothetical protein DA469_22055, partial [Bacillus subtilis]
MFRANQFKIDILYVKHTGYTESLEYYFKENESLFDFNRMIPEPIIERTINTLIRHEVKDGFIYIPAVIKSQNDVFDLFKYELLKFPIFNHENLYNLNT